MDVDNCMVDIARYFTSFTNDESCGKCTSCRDGLYEALKLLEKMTQGKAQIEDLTLLEELSLIIKDASECGLGKTAPNPILSTIKYFREEYEKHIKDKKCIGGVCKPLFEYKIDKEICKGCGRCRVLCPVNAITGEKKSPHQIDIEKCTKCGICYQNCKNRSIKKV